MSRFCLTPASTYLTVHYVDATSRARTWRPISVHRLELEDTLRNKAARRDEKQATLGDKLFWWALLAAVIPRSYPREVVYEKSTSVLVAAVSITVT